VRGDRQTKIDWQDVERIHEDGSNVQIVFRGGNFIVAMPRKRFLRLIEGHEKHVFGKIVKTPLSKVRVRIYDPDLDE
jgi:hypothetical protein